MKDIFKKLLVFPVFLLAGFTVANAQIATGGSYTLNQAVIANGGGTSSSAGNTYKVEGTSGQNAAGTNSTGGSYSAVGGFWAPNPLAPTAANAVVSGRVLGTQGEGLRNVTVILSGGNLTAPMTTRTNSFGNFTFENVLVGETYTVSVINKKFGFAQESQIISVLDNVSDVIFQAGWEN